MTYPSALPAFVNPTATDRVDDIDHAAQHADANDAIEALAAKLGTGASPASGATDGWVLTRQADGTTAWEAAASGIPSGLQTATVTLSSAQLLDLHNTQVDVIASPGPGYYLSANKVVTYFKWGSVAYAGANPPRIGTGDGPLDTAGIVYDVTLENDAIFVPTLTGDYLSDGAGIVDKPCTVFIISALTNGDSTLTVEVDYTVKAVPA